VLRSTRTNQAHASAQPAPEPTNAFPKEVGASQDEDRTDRDQGFGEQGESADQKQGADDQLLRVQAQRGQVDIREVQRAAKKRYPIIPGRAKAIICKIPMMNREITFV
jgi:hypothetical protein